MAKDRIENTWNKLLLSLYPLVILAAIWELTARAGLLPPVFLPPFSVAVAKLWELLVSGEALWALGVSLYRTAGGVALAMICGVLLGFLAAEVGPVRWLTRPLVSVGFPMPKIALLPVFTLWLGIDHISKIALVASTCLFPFMIAAQSAASSVPTKLLWAARAMGTSPFGVFARVIFPASLPSLFSGLRIAVPMGLITVFTAEMITGGGIGEQIVQAQRRFEADAVFAYLLLTIAVGYVVDDLLARYQKFVRH